MPHSITRTPHHLLALCIAALAVSTVPAGPAAAQSASIGADIVSRYVWRGADFGESASVQPGLTLAFGGLEFGAWGSYSISASSAGANENDLWASFTHELASGASISVGITDYYFPNAVVENEEGGERREPVVRGFRDAEAHTQEVSVSISGSESFPVSLYAGLVLDDETPLYFEVSAPFMVGDTELGFHAGAVSTASGFYDTEDFALVNVGVTVSREIAITESFAPPVFVSYIVNPSEASEVGNRAYLVFGLSLAP